MNIKTIEVEAKDLQQGDVIVGTHVCELVVKTGKTLLHKHKTCTLQGVLYWRNSITTKTVDEISNDNHNEPFTVIRLRDMVD